MVEDEKVEHNGIWLAMSIEEPPPEFASWRSYWNFARSVSRDYRYMRSPDEEAFLAAVLATSKARRVEIPKGRLFWRAQLGHDWRPLNSYSDDVIPCAYSRERMKPLSGRATDGRANPRGIPCLYMATSKEAAMSEVRPWIGAYVSVGQFRIKRRLTVVDCARQHNKRPFFFDLDDYHREPPPEKRSEAVWAHIDRAFAEPMTRTDDQADYAPTQIIAELFKKAGIEGVVYKSTFGDDGFNVALFDSETACLINCGLFEVKSMQLEFTEADEFYSVAEPPEA